MSEIGPMLAISSLIGIGAGLGGTYAMAKYMLSNDRINNKAIEILSDMLDNVAQNEEMQKKVYMIGALLGKGIADGTGLKGAVRGGAGKMNFSSIAAQIIGGFLQGRIPGLGQAPQAQPETAPGEW